MEYIWVAVAFIFGYAAKQLNLPPLVGYLAAGFGLHALDVKPNDNLETLSDFGVTLLLFTIGLKLNVKSLLKKEIWGTAGLHMLTMVVLATLNSIFIAYLGLSYFDELSLTSALLISFALSFSSTVCAVKFLEEKNELRFRHGQIAIGILIIQDILAVFFMTLTTDQLPSVWAFGLLLLPFTKPLIEKILSGCGHRELLPLAGIFLAYTGGELFEFVGLKAHMGALVFAVLISGQPKANELAKSLMSFKDIFLIGFFLSIGLTSLPTMDMVWVSLIMILLLPFKAGLFFIFMTQLKLRGRSSFLTSLSLTNYSEFGLIVCSSSVALGLLPKEWLVIMALVVAFSFVFSSILNTYSHQLYAYLRDIIILFEKKSVLKEDRLEIPTGATILIIGMGRVGTGAYETLSKKNQKNVCGIEVIRNRAKEHIKSGRNVVVADAEDPFFWENIDLKPVKLIMFAIPNYQDILEILKQLKLLHYNGKLAGIAKYDDHKDLLLNAGLDDIFNFYQRAGSGFAEQAIKLIQYEKN